MNADTPLDQLFWGWMRDTIEQEGFPIGHGMIRKANELIVLALDLEPEQSYQAMLIKTLEGARESIFAIDRYTLPDQSTKYGDLLAGHYFANGTWRPFIIEYRYEPRAFEPIDYGNPWWTDKLKGEIAGFASLLLRQGAS